MWLVPFGFIYSVRESQQLCEVETHQAKPTPAYILLKIASIVGWVDNNLSFHRDKAIAAVHRQYKLL